MNVQKHRISTVRMISFLGGHQRPLFIIFLHPVILHIVAILNFSKI